MVIKMSMQDNTDFWKKIEERRRLKRINEYNLEMLRKINDNSKIEDSLVYQNICRSKKVRMKNEEEICSLNDF